MYKIELYEKSPSFKSSTFVAKKLSRKNHKGSITASTPIRVKMDLIIL